MNHMTRQRVDYERLPGGGWKAIVTITWPDNTTSRYEGLADVSYGDAQVAGFFDDVAHFAKKAVHAVTHSPITKIVFPVAALANTRNPIHDAVVKQLPGGNAMLSAQKVAASALAGKKLAAASALSAAAEGIARKLPGASSALKPAMHSAASSLGVAGRLLSANVLAAHGLANEAHELVKRGVLDAHRLTRSSAPDTRRLLADANDKRKRVEQLAEGRGSSGGGRERARGHSDVVAAARAGKLRSNHAGDVSAAALLAAAKQGRVFWITA